MRLPVLLITLMIGASGLAQQGGVITGTVVDGVSGKPVSAAIVSIAGAGLTVNTGNDQYPRIPTGGDGRFVFRDLAASGSFTITATKGGYAPGASGRRRPDGESQAVELTVSQPSRDVVVRVWKYGAIAGTVIDESGEPVVGVQVRAMSWRSVGGRRQARPAGQSVFTDDRGIYRIGNLSPGEYFVLASPPLMSIRVSVYSDVARTGGRGVGQLPVPIGPNAAAFLTAGDAMLAIPRGAVTPPPPVGTKLQIYPTTFHPGSLSPTRASTVVLAAGEERSGIDVQLQPVSAARVSGTIVSPGDVPTEMVRLVTAGDGDLPPEVQGSAAFADRSGAFTFAAVIPGQYKLQTTTGGGSEMYFADLPLTVSDDIDGLTVVLSPSLKVSARLQFDGTTARPEGARGNFVPFSLEPVDAGQPGAPPGRSGTISDNRFTLGGFLPGRYVVRIANSPQGWMFKGAMLNGVDVSETPLELTRDTGDIVVTFTDRWSGVNGTVQGRGNDDAAVIVFPTDAQRWTTPASSPRRLRLSRTNARGEFGLTLPPGDYFVVAIPADQSDDWRNPATLDSLARLASQITILEGQNETIGLQLRQVRQ
jgi:Carboxypeptidase regulatory-like domain